MAEEEKKTEPPALIDYYGESDEQTDDWSEANFKNYWSRRLVAIHKMSALPWTIKEHTLWKRLVDTYDAQDLVSMIDKWMQVSTKPSDFVAFYMKRNHLHLDKTREEWEWE